MGAILNIHRFFRVLAKPLTWLIYFSLVQVVAISVMSISDYSLFHKNVAVVTASV